MTGVFEFGSGVEGVGVWNYDAFPPQDEVEIAGTAGVLGFSCFAEEPLRLLTARGEERIDAPYPKTVQLPLIQTVVNALTGQGSHPVPDRARWGRLESSTACSRTTGIVTESATRGRRRPDPTSLHGLGCCWSAELDKDDRCR